VIDAGAHLYFILAKAPKKDSVLAFCAHQ